MAVVGEVAGADVADEHRTAFERGAHAAGVDGERRAREPERSSLVDEERRVGAVELRLVAALARAPAHVVGREVALARKALVDHGKRRGAAARQREGRGAVDGGAPAGIPLVEARHLA